MSNSLLVQPSELGDDPELAAPIDNYVWYAAIVSLIYVFYKVKAMSLQENSSKQ